MGMLPYTLLGLLALKMDALYSFQNTSSSLPVFRPQHARKLESSWQWSFTVFTRFVL
jgi:hypothetical protein